MMWNFGDWIEVKESKSMSKSNEWYKKLLQTFACNLVWDEDCSLARQLHTESSIVKLEGFISNKMVTEDASKFYYEAGVTTETVSREATGVNNDVYKKYLSAFNDFCKFIELDVD